MAPRRQAGTRGKADTVKLNVRMPAALAQRLKIECIKRGVRIQAGVQEAVRLWLKEEKP